MDGLSLFKIQKFINKYYIPCELNGVFETESGILFDIYKEKRFDIAFDLSKNVILFDQKAAKLKKLNFFYKKQAILKLDQKGYDRILEFTISSRKSSGKLENFYIVVEFVGGNSNLFILNEDRKIIYRLNDKNIDSDRDITIGKIYSPFKKNKIYTIDNINLDKIRSFNELEGFYPKTAEFIDKIASESSKDTALKYLNKQLFDEYLYIDNKGRFYPFLINENLKKVKIDAVTPFKGSDDTDVLRNRLLSYLLKRKTKKEILLEKLQTKLLEAKDYEKHKNMAEILKNNYPLIKNSKGKTSVFDYTECGVEKIEIDVSNIKDIDENLTSLYEKYKKLKRSVAPISKRIQEISSKIEELEEEIFNIESADKDELTFIYNFYFSKKSSKTTKEAAEKVKKVFYKGYNILIGKNSKTNQELVFHIANPNDIWMHTQKTPSAHVIVKRDENVKDNDENVLEDVILFAAKITAYFSKAKYDKKVNVDYTLRKFVKKPKKSKEGFVIYSNFKTVTVTPLSEDEYSNLI